MSDKYCPAGKIECETLDWQPMCNGVTINHDAMGCIRPSRQQPMEIAIPQKDSHPEYQRGRADALKEAVEKLKNMTMEDEMDKKLTLKPDNNIRYFRGCLGTLTYLIEHNEFDEAVQFIGEIYLNGRRAQAVADRVAVMKTKKHREQSLDGHIDWLFTLDAVLAALKAVEPSTEIEVKP